MQYHVSGFKPGDPDVHPAAPGHWKAGDPLPETVDVLIAGSGPAGLCLAAQLARFPSIRTMLVEPKLTPMEKGQADGISVRSMEMFQAFGFADRITAEAYNIGWMNFWAPDPENPDRIVRTTRTEELIGFAHTSAELRARVEHRQVIRQLGLQLLTRPTRKQALVDGKAARTSEYFGGVNVVLFAPEDLRGGVYYFSPTAEGVLRVPVGASSAYQRSTA